MTKKNSNKNLKYLRVFGDKGPGRVVTYYIFLALIHFVQWLLKTIKDAKSTFVQYLIICPLSQ